ncbi:hypothetical protein BN1263170275 [Stenotrophomonas maltophilia]|nr:hypothetical protein BN1263170275 [Stenotrophomonas maltophilia]
MDPGPLDAASCPFLVQDAEKRTETGCEFSLRRNLTVGPVMWVYGRQSPIPRSAPP